MDININHLIELCDKISNTLSEMADNERKFGWDLCHRIEQLSYEMHKNSQELRQINSFTLYVS